MICWSTLESATLSHTKAINSRGLRQRSTANAQRWSRSVKQLPAEQNRAAYEASKRERLEPTERTLGEFPEAVGVLADPLQQLGHVFAEADQLIGARIARCRQPLLLFAQLSAHHPKFTTESKPRFQLLPKGIFQLIMFSSFRLKN